MVTIDILSLCTHCGRDTEVGGDLWIDRIPSLASAESAQDWFQDWEKVTYLDGWMCRECQAYECEICGESVSDFDESNSEFGHFHIVCLDKFIAEKIGEK